MLFTWDMQGLEKKLLRYEFVNDENCGIFGSEPRESMKYLNHLKKTAKSIRSEINVYRCVLRHSGTPWLSKAMLAVAIGYLLLPFDLIPDFIPVVGLLDDVIIVPALILLALKGVPDSVMDECRAAVLEPCAKVGKL